MRDTLQVWYQAIRPFSLSASLVPVCVGSMLAAQAGGVQWGVFALVILAALLVQSGTNLTDEYADHQPELIAHKVLAPYKVIARGALTRHQVRQGAMLCFGLAAVIGLYLVTRTSWPLALVCLASVGVAYGYSAGPWPLGNLGLGEPLVFVFMGPVMVVGSLYVQVHTVSWAAVWLSLPVACLVTAILVVNNLRDVDEDRRSGKRTFATLWGQPVGVGVFRALLGTAFGSLPLLAAPGIVPWLSLVPFVLVMPQGWRLLQMVRGDAERFDLHHALRGTAQLHLRFGGLLTLGVVLRPYLPL